MSCWIDKTEHTTHNTHHCIHRSLDGTLIWWSNCIYICGIRFLHLCDIDVNAGFCAPCRWLKCVHWEHTCVTYVVCVWDVCMCVCVKMMCLSLDCLRWARCYRNRGRETNNDRCINRSKANPKRSYVIYIELWKRSVFFMECI